ncbi:LOW QUALITY PROTEIN: sodium- and chloride-dependent neutral and basic amino acid transporter B(0+)-like [Amphiura filiformis]|uniref:LOW QUALITY PROTEIN: sodium- and chloride-dependent neutral and basic amino acid transporter B(0+)-like n=1 Tax=Amphiura filiformis TaxID=82378 RepID=UPI003B21DC84
MTDSASNEKIPVQVFVNDPAPLPAKKPGSGDENEERGNWTSQMDFMLSCIGYAVGLGNVWRFPYLCYSNGGGAFLIPYVIMLMFAGIPLFFLELSIGQYGSNGPIRCWRSVPAIRGVGYGMVAASAFVGIYYNVIICYTIFYMIQSLTSVLPWEDCHHSWNSYLCSELFDESVDEGGIVTLNKTCPIANLTSEEKAFYNVSEDGNLTHYTDPFHDDRKGPSEEFYRNGMLHDSGSIEESGYVIWQLALCLLLAWLIVFLCLAKGIKSSGKVVYFTATFPYIVLFILLIRGLTLPGFKDGIIFFITPRWELLKNPKVWKDAAVQIFYSLSASWGGLTTLSSYNRFKNNCFRDAMIVPLLNCATSVFAGVVIFSILGAMAYELGKPVAEVVDEQFGLAFVAYPEAVTHMPGSPVWSFLFFFMLLTLGLDSQFCIIETVVTALTDQFPDYLRPRKTKLVAGYCTACFFIGLICVTQAGSYWVVLMDKYAADFALLIFAFMECIGIGWIYGAKRFTNDIRTMVGDRIVDSVLFKWWSLNWCFLTPAVLSFVLLFNWSSWSNPTAGDYEFPAWAHGFGWVLIMSSISWIPIVWVYEFVKAEGSILERFRAMGTPTSDWGPALPAHRNEAYNVHERHGTTMGGTIDGFAPEDYMHVNQPKYVPTENGIAMGNLRGESV